MIEPTHSQPYEGSANLRGLARAVGHTGPSTTPELMEERFTAALLEDDERIRLGARAQPSQAPRHYDLLLAGMVAVLLCSNLIGPAKVCRVIVPGFGPVDFGAGNLFFPIGYIFSDVMTEVYGYARARRAIWAGFGALAFATLMTTVVLAMPPSPVEPFNRVLQPALQTALGSTWRIVAASMLAYWAGDFVNSFVMAKMKVWTQGRWLWTRTIGSTVVGQAVDSALFYPVAFYGIWETHTLLVVLGFNFLFKVGVEVLATPVTYRVVAFLKKAEGCDEVFDRHTLFNPFSLKL